MDFKAPLELRNPLSKAIPGKFHGSCWHSNRSYLQDRTNFHRSRAWQIVLILITGEWIKGFLFDRVMMSSTKGLYSLSCKTSYRKISWSLEAARFRFKLFQSLWNLAGTSAAALPRCLSNFRAILLLQHPISRLRDFTRFSGKTSYRLVNRGPGVCHIDTARPNTSPLHIVMNSDYPCVVGSCICWEIRNSVNWCVI